MEKLVPNLYKPNKNAKSKIVYQGIRVVIGEHLQSNEWVMYSVKLTIFAQ